MSNKRTQGRRILRVVIVGILVTLTANTIVKADAPPIRQLTVTAIHFYDDEALETWLRSSEGPVSFVEPTWFPLSVLTHKRELLRLDTDIDAGEAFFSFNIGMFAADVRWTAQF